MAKASKIFLTTDFMPVIRAYTTKPAKPYNEGDEPKFEIQLKPTDAQVEAWTAKVKKAVGDATFKTKKPKFGISVKEEDESISIRAKSKFKPMIFDAKNNPLVDPKLGANSIVRAQVLLNVYDKGVALTLHQIQIKTLVEWEGSSQTSSFDEDEDGYEAPEDSRGFKDEESEDADGSSPLDL